MAFALSVAIVVSVYVLRRPIARIATLAVAIAGSVVVAASRLEGDYKAVSI